MNDQKDQASRIGRLNRQHIIPAQSYHIGAMPKTDPVNNMVFWPTKGVSNT